MRISIVFICVFALFSGNLLFGQELLRADVVSNENASYGFDAYQVEEWSDHYEQVELNDSVLYFVPYLSVTEDRVDSIDIQFSSVFNLDQLSFSVDDSLWELPIVSHSDSSVRTVLPKMHSDYSIEILVRDSLVGKLNVIVYPIQQERLVIVPMVKMELNIDSLQSWLNSVYRPAYLSLEIELGELFSPEDFDDTLFSNPSQSYDRFTEQMIYMRDAYFELHPSANRNAYYLFIVPGFVDDQIRGYMVRNKGIAFVKNDESPNFYRTIVRTLGYGIGVLEDTWSGDGPEKGTTGNLMDTVGVQLTYMQWESIQHSCHSVSYFDDYEDVRTNSGLIAYYFWEEDKEGNIILLNGNVMKSIKRPFKRNQFSLHLNIENWFYLPLFKIQKYRINLLHFISFIFLFVGSIFLRRRVLRIQWELIQQSRLIKIIARASVFSLFLYTFYSVFSLINYGYLMFEVKSGELTYLEGMPTKLAIREIGDNKNYMRIAEKDQGSEVLIKKEEKWELRRLQKVLYFSVDKIEDEWTNYRFVADSDSLKIDTKDYSELATSHYMVISYIENGECAYQKIYNHLGVEITNKIAIDDPAERILLFVNGYRPTSLGATFEENFEDIKKNGLEFDNSKNLIYNFDRYDYWRPWKEIDLMFKNRVNPSQTYYADGHFSVSTSNHQSLFGFTTLSNAYPSRCTDLEHHVCQKKVNNWEFFGITSEGNTSDMLPKRPNKNGFNTRVLNGQIAGRNLQQMFNELPNKSSNDTLYIVAHSMGYAYALGIIEKLRGKVNFGGLYIMAPENANSGTVNPDEWQEIWQYGSDFEKYRYSAPCLLDGIAVQTKAAGLAVNHRAFIPEKMLGKMSFFNAHFIGNYTWIFDIPENETGYIQQR